jgi:hypothetical protein
MLCTGRNTAAESASTDLAAPDRKPGRCAIRRGRPPPSPARPCSWLVTPSGRNLMAVLHLLVLALLSVLALAL